MKKALFARGILGSLSLVGVIGAIGCSAGGEWDEGAAGEGEIGSVEQAITVFTPSPAVSLQFGGFIKIPGTEKMLHVGGYNSAGTAVSTSGIVDPSASGAARWKVLRNAADTADNFIPTALGEVEIAPIPGQTNKFLVAGGRGTLDGDAVNNSYILTLDVNNNGNLHQVSWVQTGNMDRTRVIGLKNLQKCGDSKLIAIAGMIDEGMKSLAGTQATEQIGVFTYVAAPNENTSSWSTLRLAADTNEVVQLQTQRGYASIAHVSDTDFRILGGANNTSTKALLTSEKLVVNSSCQATNAEDINGDPENPDYRTPFGTNLPAARARFALAPKAVTANPGSGNVNYDFVYAGGNDATAGSALATPAALVLFDPQGASGAGAFHAPCNISAPRLFPRFADVGSTLKLATGVQPKATSSFNTFWNTTAVVEVFTVATAACSTTTALDASRVGSSVEPLTVSSVTEGYAAFGAQHVNQDLPGSMTTDVERF